MIRPVCIWHTHADVSALFDGQAAHFVGIDRGRLEIVANRRIRVVRLIFRREETLTDLELVNPTSEAEAIRSHLVRSIQRIFLVFNGVVFR